MNKKIADLISINKNGLEMENVVWQPKNTQDYGYSLISPLRRLNLFHLLNQVLEYGTEGEVVELGCYAGMTAILIREILNYHKSSKNLHVYDSFEGLSLPSKEDIVKKEWHKVFNAQEQILIDNFKKHNLKLPLIHKGWLDKTLPHELPDKICFAHLDSDLHDPIKLSLESIYPRLTEKAVVLVDDYGHRTWTGVKKACDEFRKNDFSFHNLGILTAATGSDRDCHGYFRKL